MHNVYRATTDFVLARPDVDPERLVVSGMSYGGAKTMVHASCDDRFAAAVPNSPVYSMASFIERGMPSFLRGSAEEAAEQTKKMPYTGQVLFAASAWSHGFDSIAEWYHLAKEAIEVDPKDVKCPLLSMYSEAEHPEMQRQAIDTYEKAPNKKNAIFKGTEEDGADLHCQLNNLPLSYQVMFDWLDEVLDYNIQLQPAQ
ncbi:alpha/beta hydrolase family protein [Paenibacillus rhizoplanae]